MIIEYKREMDMSRENENEFQILKGLILQYKILKNKACIFTLYIKPKDRMSLYLSHLYTS